MTLGVLMSPAMPAQQFDNIALLDESFLSEMLDVMGADDLRAITGAFWSMSDELAQDVIDAVAREDEDARKVAAHTLKGASANVGAARVAEVCRLIEQASPPDLPPLVTALKDALTETPAALERRLNG